MTVLKRLPPVSGWGWRGVGQQYHLDFLYRLAAQPAALGSIACKMLVLQAVS